MTPYHIGQRMEFPGLAIVVRRQSYMPDRIVAQPRLPESPIEVGSDIDIDSASTQEAISRIVWNIAHAVAPALLLPRARQLAADLGLTVTEWRISYGRRILGRCTSRGIISLSCINVFLPSDLRDYIVWHELAHLSEMNHGPRFHSLCNTYCGGREGNMRAMLRTVKWPLLPLKRKQT